MTADIRAVIVDLDGTMVDTLGDFDVALNETLKELGRPGVTRTDIERMVGKGSAHLIRSALRHGGLDEAGAAALQDGAWTRYQAHYRAINGAHSAVYPGVEAGLQALSRQPRFTSKQHRTTNKAREYRYVPRRHNLLSLCSTFVLFLAMMLCCFSCSTAAMHMSSSSASGLLHQSAYGGMGNSYQPSVLQLVAWELSQQPFRYRCL